MKRGCRMFGIILVLIGIIIVISIILRKTDEFNKQEDSNTNVAKEESEKNLNIEKIKARQPIKEEKIMFKKLGSVTPKIAEKKVVYKPATAKLFNELTSDYIGRRVFHKYYGYGRILSIKDNKYMEIKFEDSKITKEFPINIIQNKNTINLVDENENSKIIQPLENNAEPYYEIDFEREKLDHDYQTDFNFMDRLSRNNKEKEIAISNRRN